LYEIIKTKTGVFEKRENELNSKMSKLSVEKFYYILGFNIEIINMKSLMLAIKFY